MFAWPLQIAGGKLTECVQGDACLDERPGVVVSFAVIEVLSRERQVVAAFIIGIGVTQPARGGEEILIVAFEKLKAQGVVRGYGNMADKSLV